MTVWLESLGQSDMSMHDTQQANNSQKYCSVETTLTSSCNPKARAKANVDVNAKGRGLVFDYVIRLLIVYVKSKYIYHTKANCDLDFSP